MKKKLGFGFMRLPLVDQKDQTSFDYIEFNKMVDTFMEKGFNYYDTAFVYHAFKSEEALRKSLVNRYNRNEFEIATKLPPGMVKSVEDQERIFNEQLEKCGVEYFDYYLVHNIGKFSYKDALKFDTFGFVLNKKEEGKIKNVGFSFHDTPELLEEVLNKYPEMDFVQLQINYIDWENKGIQAKKCYEIAREHNMPIIVMEPLKGGNLVNVPEKASELMKKYNPDSSIASWAIRYAASLEGVIMVLSGMSNLKQVVDNTSYMENFNPLNNDEYKIIDQIIDLINEDTAVACTFCRYCEEKCPKNIAIPDYFSLYNSAKRKTTTNISSQFVYYMNLTASRGKASDCIDCKQCDKICPQHLKITKHLKDVANEFEEMMKMLQNRSE